MLVAGGSVARDIHGVGQAVLPTLIGGGRVLVGHACAPSIEVFNFHCSRHGPGAAAIGRARGRWQHGREPEPIEGPHIATGPGRHHHHAHGMDARRQVHAAVRHGLVRVPRPGVGNRQRTRFVFPVDENPEAATGPFGRHPCLEGIGAAGGDVDRIVHPLAGGRPPHHMVVGGGRVARNIHPVGQAVLPAFIGGGGIVIRHAVAADIEVFHFHRSRHRPGRAAIGPAGRCRSSRRQPEPIKRPYMAAGARGHHGHAHGMDARRQVHPAVRHGLVRVPRPRAGNSQGTRFIFPVNENPEPPARPHRRHPRIQGVGPAGGHRDGVLQPFAGRGPAHHMLIAGRGVARNIHRVGQAVLPALVGGGGIVIGHAVAADIEVFYLHRPGQRPGRPAIGGALHRAATLE